jgi:hypothetical protein
MAPLLVIPVDQSPAMLMPRSAAGSRARLPLWSKSLRRSFGIARPIAA